MTERLNQHYEIDVLTEDDLVEATEMRLQSWLDTYVNEDVGVTKEWIEARNKSQLSEDNMRRRIEQMKNLNTQGWVAKDSGGKIIGATTPYIDDTGVQHVGSLYVDKQWHGTGVASELMQKAIDWFDPQKPIVLSVVSYNDRAQRFYKKWGFKEVAGSDSLFADKIPEIEMVREGDKNEI